MVNDVLPQLADTFAIDARRPRPRSRSRPELSSFLTTRPGCLLRWSPKWLRRSIAVPLSCGPGLRP